MIGVVRREKVLAGGLADMVLCDPPYGVAHCGQDGEEAHHRQRRSRRRLRAVPARRVGNMLAVTKEAIYVCMSSSEIHTLQRVFREAGGHWSTFVVWAKNTFTMGRSDYQRQYEPILYGWKEGTDHFWCGARDQGDVWFI